MSGNNSSVFLFGAFVVATLAAMTAFYVIDPMTHDVSSDSAVCLFNEAAQTAQIIDVETNEITVESGQLTYHASGDGNLSGGIDKVTNPNIRTQTWDKFRVSPAEGECTTSFRYGNNVYKIALP